MLTLLALIAFAGNSILCRWALKETSIDPASFTAMRLLSGAMFLGALVWLRGGYDARAGSWPGAAALFVYAACFSIAYVNLSTGAGALILFGAVQATMIGVSAWRGEQLSASAWGGLIMALAGLAGLLMPGTTAPPWLPALVMLIAGIAWGTYSLLGQGVARPLPLTTSNFVRACLFVVPFWILWPMPLQWDRAGLLYALASGALASGAGYALWYAVLPLLRAATAASVQLSVPIIAAVGGALLLNEPLTVRLFLASLVILSGIALVIFSGKQPH